MPIKAGNTQNQGKETVKFIDKLVWDLKNVTAELQVVGWDSLNPVAKGILVGAAQLADQLAKTVKESAVSDLKKDPDAIPGYNLTYSNRSEISDTLAVENLLKKVLKFNSLDIANCVSYTFGAIEKVAQTHYPDLDKSAVASMVKDALAPAITIKKTTKLTKKS